MTDGVRTTVSAALAEIDEVNAGDPRELIVDGVPRPKALAEAELATAWVDRLCAEAGRDVPVALRLAARAHHLRRWEVPRATYPEGRAGYLRWKNDLHRKHATDVGALLTGHGVDAATVTRVQDLVRKRGLATGGDDDVQTLEDALCLVFLATQFDELAARLDDDVMVEVLRKSVAKMSPGGLAAAGAIAYSDHQKSLLDKAVQGTTL